ncbi:ribonuclease HI [Lolliginicoccus suaedae]|uniref:ribonuclease HI n=1 Tax=Lolliginicoccus suaedae TaxID=2605429 RepID=UPI0011ED58F7|nr:RNase H family protein [Lolliginicoccus suaedae]
MPVRWSVLAHTVRRGLTGRTTPAPLLPAAPRWRAVIRTFQAPCFTGDALSPTAWAVAAVTDGTHLTTHVASAPLPTTVGRATDNAIALAGLECFGGLYEAVESAGGELSLHIHDAVLRRLVRDAAASFPLVTMTGAFPRSAERAKLSDATARAMRSITAHHEALLREHQARQPVLLIGTDASIDRLRPGAGIAAIDADGRTTTRFLRSISDTFHAELAAIELAIDATPGTRPLRILSDNQHAVLALGKKADLQRIRNSSTRALVQRIRSKRNGRRIEITWVRGHNGNSLNEAAHRLAVATRRCRIANATPGALRAISHTIASDLRAAQPA